MHRTFEIGGHQVGVRTNSVEFGGWMDRTLAAYATPAAGKDHYYSIRVPDPQRKNLGRPYNTLYEGGVASIRTFSMPVIGTALLNELVAWEAATRPQGIYLDAGVAEVDGTALLLSSRLMRWLGQHERRTRQSGVRLSAQLTVSVDPQEGTVASVPWSRDVSASAADELSALPSTTGPFDRISLESPVRIVAACDYDWQQELVQRSSRAALLRTLASRALNLVAAPGPVLLGLGAFMESIEAFSVDTTRPQAAIDAIVQIARGA